MSADLSFSLSFCLLFFARSRVLCSLSDATISISLDVSQILKRVFLCPTAFICPDVSPHGGIKVLIKDRE